MRLVIFFLKKNTGTTDKEQDDKLYGVVRCPNSDGRVGVVLKQHQSLIGLGRVIIYCQPSPTADEVGKKYGMLVYHAS